MSFGTTKSSGSSRGQLGSLDFSTPITGELLGFDVRGGKKGFQLGKFGPGQGPDFFSGGLQQGALDPLANLFAPVQSFQFDLPNLGAGVQGGFDTLTEASRTGLIQPSIDLFRTIFEQEILPSTMEELGANLGLNKGDTDLAAILAREGARGSAELAASAADRQLLASQALPGFAGQATQLESAFQQRERDRREANQVLNQLFQMLSGMTPQAASVGGGSQDSLGFNF